MYQIVELSPKAGFRLFVRFDDGLSGEVDLSALAGRGAFSTWKTPGVFESVAIASETGAPTWPGGIDIGPDTLYFEITGRNPSGAFQPTRISITTH